MRLFAILMFVHSVGLAQVTIENRYIGSNYPSSPGYEVLPNIYHSPQYMPNWPTAATIWPRVVDVECNPLVPDTCKGYNYSPEMGRAEYLFYRPVIKQPETCCARDRVILMEVPVKGNKE